MSTLTDTASIPSLSTRPANESDWIHLIRTCLDNSQFFQAYDLCLESLKQFPDSLMLRLVGALALVQSGAVHEARKLLEPIAEHMISSELLARQLIQRLQDRLPQFIELAPAQEPSRELLQGIGDWARDLVRLGSSARHTDAQQHEVLSLLAQIYFRIWVQEPNPDDLKRSFDHYAESFWLTRNPESGINAALLGHFLNQPATTERLAWEVIEILEALPEAGDSRSAFQQLTFAAEAHWLLGHLEQAQVLYCSATRLPDLHYSWVVAELQRIALMQKKGTDIPQHLVSTLTPPTLIIFSGQPLDNPQATTPCFPPSLEAIVKQAIHTELERLNARIGYCAAGAGSELLFIEAMLEREAEVHIYLPCAIEDYVAARVRYAGAAWERRFHNALRLAASVNYSTRERLLGHDNLFRFNNQVIEGMARLRASFLLTEPQLILVWDALAKQEAGTAADFMNQWADITTLHLINLDELDTSRDTLPSAAESPASQAKPAWPSLRVEPERVVKAMLFADIVGFSKLQEEHLPRLWQFLENIRQTLDLQPLTPDLIESWGDAIYVVMPDAQSMLRFALALRQGFNEFDSLAYGFPQPLRIRIGLHAGPVFSGRHPLTGRDIVYGSHVSRAARIEPITVPGEIYASQQFVALLTVEHKAFQHQREMTGQTGEFWYDCEYVGNLALAKRYGEQPLYHLRPR